MSSNEDRLNEMLASLKAKESPIPMVRQQHNVPPAVLRLLMEHQWHYKPIRSGVNMIGWRYEGEMATIKGEVLPPRLVACHMAMSKASIALRARMNMLRQNFIRKLYRGRYASI